MLPGVLLIGQSEECARLLQRSTAGMNFAVLGMTEEVQGS